MKTLLTHLQQSFSAWQATSSKKRHSNAILRAEAVKCLDHYSYREISAAIGVSTTTLRSWQRSFNHDQEVVNANPFRFVGVNLDHTEDMGATTQVPISLQISLPCGITIAYEADENVYDYLVALQKYKQCVKQNPEAWLPWNYKKTLSVI